MLLKALSILVDCLKAVVVARYGNVVGQFNFLGVVSWPLVDMLTRRRLRYYYNSSSEKFYTIVQWVWGVVTWYNGE